MAKKIEYQNVNVSKKNKNELERIRRELERFHKLTVGRELKMMDLKKEIEILKKKSNKL